MRKIATYDVETISSDDMHLAMLGFFDGIDYFYFTDVKTFLKKVLTRKYRNYYFFAHAGGRFDIRFILEELKNNEKDYKEFEIDIITISSSFILTFKKDKHKWIFADSYLLFHTSLKKLGDAFDLKYKKLEHDFNENFILNEKNIEYNKIDCLSLYEALNKFFDLLNMKKIKMTIASAALYVYKTKHVNFSNYCPVLNHKAEELVRRSYVGGRCEIFKPVLEKGYCYDFNSLYPSVMLFEPAPAGFYHNVQKRNKNKIGFYDADVYVPNLLIPPLPLRFKNKLLFPTGNFSGAFSGIELDLLERMAGKYIIKNGIEFTKKVYLFKGYVNKFYKLKNEMKESNPAMSYISKLMLNSLYGKFGQRRENVSLYLNPESDKEMDFLYDEELNIFAKKTISTSKHILPYISAHITALARIKLYEVFLRIGFENVYYCDTDSIYTTEKLETSDEIGALKLEYNCYNFTFKLPKTYCGFKTDEHIFISKAKGFDTDFDFQKQKIKLAGIKECIKNNNQNIIKSDFQFLKFKYYNKENKAVYDKRILDGNSSLPLNFENDIIPQMNFFDRPDISDIEKNEYYREKEIKKHKGKKYADNLRKFFEIYPNSDISEFDVNENYKDLE